MPQKIVRWVLAAVARPTTWGLLAVVVAVAARFRLLGHWADGELFYLFNSDTLFPFHIWTDVLSDRYPMSGWNLPVAPFTFPDIPLAGLALLLSGGHVSGALAVYGLLQFLILVGGFWFCAWAVGVSNRSTGAALLAVAATILMVSGVAQFLPTHTASGGVVEWLASCAPVVVTSQLFLPQMHSGTLAVVVWAVGAGVLFLKRSAERGGRWGSGTALLVLAALGAAGNLLFFAQFVGPFVIVCGFIAVCRVVRLRDAAAAAVGVVTAAAAGRWIASRLMPSGDVAGQTSGTGQAEVLTAFCLAWLENVKALDVFHVASAAWLLVGAGAAVALLVGGLRRSDPAWWTWLAVFAVLTTGAGVASLCAIASGGAHKSVPLSQYYGWGMKYFHPLIYCPVFGFALLAGAAVRGSRVAAWATTAVALATAVVVLVQTPPPPRPVISYRPAVARFVDELADEYGIQLGVSEIWAARLVNLYSERGVRAHPIYPMGEPHRWLANDFWATGGGRRHPRPPAYTFVLYDLGMGDNPVREHLDRTFGPPAAVRQAGPYLATLYNRPEDEDFRDHFYETVAPPPAAPVPVAYTGPPVGKLTDFRSAAVWEDAVTELSPPHPGSFRRRDVPVRVRLTNRSAVAWPPVPQHGELCIHIGCRVFDAKDGRLAAVFSVPLDREVGPGEPIVTTFKLKLKPGAYRVDVSGVQHGHAWFDDVDRSNGAVYSLTVH